jgi:pimeloyl-ACP methyl ester carboxylesterase
VTRIALPLAILIVAVPWAAPAQQAEPSTGSVEAIFTIFVRGAIVGTEEVSVTREAGGWTIVSSGRLGPPIDIVNRRMQLRYDDNWKPLELSLDATIRGQAQTIHTTITGTTATSEVNIAGRPTAATATTNAEMFFPNPFFGAIEALAARLRTAAPGSTIAAFSPVQTDIAVRVGDSVNDRIQTPKQIIETKHTRVTVTPQIGGAVPFDAEVWADSDGRLLRYSVPDQALEVVREDIGSVATRRVPISRPNDEQVRVPANGFVLAGTLSKPAAAAAPRLPAVLLVGGNGQTDRDEVTFGIPIFGQLADAFADAGFVVLRYDKRGAGQSGGRVEAATLEDFAGDVRAAVRFLGNRRDVDPRRIAVVGHGEGGSVAMLAATKETRISALVLIATLGTTGADLNLNQVARAVERSGRSEADKQATIELQKSIQRAVLTGVGWDERLAVYRRQADTPWFQSFLAFDPARVMRDIRQPVLIVHGELDTQVPPAHADLLQTMANQRRNRPPAPIVKLAALNHLLVPAKTGEVDEYVTLTDKRVSPEVPKAIVGWLQSIPAR